MPALILQEEIVALYEKEAADKTEEYMKKTPRQKCKSTSSFHHSRLVRTRRWMLALIGSCQGRSIQPIQE